MVLPMPCKCSTAQTCTTTRQQTCLQAEAMAGKADNDLTLEQSARSGCWHKALFVSHHEYHQQVALKSLTHLHNLLKEATSATLKATMLLHVNLFGVPGRFDLWDFL